MIPVRAASPPPAGQRRKKTKSSQVQVQEQVQEQVQVSRICRFHFRQNRHLPLLPAFARYADKTGRPGGVELRCCPRSLAVLQACCGQEGLPPNVVPASAADWGCEFLDYILAVKTVSSAEEAISHINRFGTRHSESVLTGSRETARRFQREVDAACVYVNASTRFTDGGQFGMGAELGISTQKLHARGPMGVEALTSIKYLIDGDGQIRP